MKVMRLVGAVLAIGLGVVVGVAMLGAQERAPGVGIGSGREGGAALPLARRSSDEEQTIRIYKQAEQAVVFITTISLAVDPFDIFPEVQQREGSGSGIIVDAERGIVLTNLHVIQDAHRIEITLISGETVRAKLLGLDEEFDIAVLQLINPPRGLVSLPFGDSAQVEVGQRVLAIGNPFGLDRTLTTGIISSVNRTVRGSKNRLMRGLLQTDAAINPGNSGGAAARYGGSFNRHQHRDSEPVG